MARDSFSKASASFIKQAQRSGQKPAPWSVQNRGISIDRKANGQSDRQSDKWTDRQTDKHIEMVKIRRKKERKEFKSIYRQTNICTDNHAIHFCGQTDIQIKSETFIQTYEQIFTQTDGQYKL